MRITQNMMNTQLLRNVNNNLLRISEQQEQLATQRKVNKPSDDPVALTYALRYRGELKANEQYQRNTDDALSIADFVDTAMGQMNSVLQRARELAVRGANGTNSQESLNAIAQEVEQLYNELVTIGNSQFNGKYVFNGQNTTEKPFPNAAAAEMDTPDNGAIRYEIGPGSVVQVNVDPLKVFGAGPSGTDPDELNTFQILKNLQGALAVGDLPEINNQLGKLDERTDAFLAQWSDVGARMNRLELADNRLKDISNNLQEMLGKTEDADLAEVITNLKTYENVYQASLSVGARMIRASLVDFMR